MMHDREDGVKFEENEVTDKEKRELEYAKISFEFYMTKDEADKILNKPKSQVAKNARKYMNSILEHAAKKFFEEEKDITDCNE